MNTLLKFCTVLAITLTSRLDAYAGELTVIAEATNGGQAVSEGRLSGDGVVALSSIANGNGSRACTYGEARGFSGGAVEMRLTSIAADGGDAFVDGYGEAEDGGFTKIEAVSAARAGSAFVEAQGSARGSSAETHIVSRSHAVDGGFARAKSFGSSYGCQSRAPVRAFVHNRSEAWHGSSTESIAVSTAQGQGDRPSIASATAFNYGVGPSRRPASKITAEAHSRGGRATASAFGDDR